MTLTSPASQDRLPVNDTIEYVEIAILQSVDSKILITATGCKLYSQYGLFLSTQDKIARSIDSKL